MMECDTEHARGHGTTPRASALAGVTDRSRAVMSRAAFLEDTDRLIGPGRDRREAPWDLFRAWLLDSDRLLERVWGRMDRYHLAWLNVGRDWAPPGSDLDEAGTARFIAEVASAKVAVLRTMRVSVERRLANLCDEDEEDGDRRQVSSIAPGGLAAVLAHPDDESIGSPARWPWRTMPARRAAAGRHPRRGGNAERRPDPTWRHPRGGDALRGATIGMDEVTVVDGTPTAPSPRSPSTLVDEIAVWLADRRPEAVITFGAHGVTNDADHVVVGAATRWAVERLAESGRLRTPCTWSRPSSVPAAATTSPRRRGPPATGSRSPNVAGRKLAALACHASQTDIAEEISELRAALDRDGVDLRGLYRVRPPCRAAPDLLLAAGLAPRRGEACREVRGNTKGSVRILVLNWSAMTIDSNLAKVDEVMTALYDIHDPEIGMSIVDLDLIKNVEIGGRRRPPRSRWCSPRRSARGPVS